MGQREVGCVGASHDLEADCAIALEGRSAIFIGVGVDKFAATFQCGSVVRPLLDAQSSATRRIISDASY